MRKTNLNSEISSGFHSTGSSSEESGNRKRLTRRHTERMEQDATDQSQRDGHSSSQPKSDPGELHNDDVVRYLKIVTAEKESDDASMPSWEDPVSVFFSVTKPEIKTDDYVKRLVRYAQCSRAAFIIGMVYLRRLETSNSKLAITPYNMHRLLITSLMIAAKNLDDRCYSNAHYARVGGIATVKEVNRLELQMLALLRYNIYVSQEEYTYFVDSLSSGEVPDLSARIARVHDVFPREMQRSCAVGISPMVSVPKLRIHRIGSNRSSNLAMQMSNVREYCIDEPSVELRVLPLCRREKNLCASMPTIQCKFVIADESHYLKSGTALRSKAVLPLIQQCKRALLLSGTPALSRPVELYTQVNSLVPTLFPNYREYVERYCNAHHGRFGYDVNGSSNLKELHILLRASVLIRRKKDDVLTQLPAKRRQVLYVETKSSFMAKIKKCFQDLNRAKLQTQQASGDDVVMFKNKERALNTELYQLSGMAKLESVQEHLKETADTGVKFIVFAHHREVIDGITEYVTKKLKLSYIRIDGGTPQADRQGLCKSFQEDSNVRVALLSITAAGVGLTLTAATVVLFAELYWNPGSLIQAEDRAHRIGQHDCVFVKYLLAKQTFDDSMWKTIQRKFDVIGKSLTGASATIDLATQTPEKVVNVDESISIDDNDEDNEVQVVSVVQSKEENRKQLTPSIDLTQDEPVDKARSASKTMKGSINVADMFPTPDNVIDVDSVADEHEPIDADIKYAMQLRDYFTNKQ